MLAGQLLQLEKAKPLVVGWIPYWNLLPFKHELNRLFPEQVVFKTSHPAQVNHWLQEGLIDIAPCSSICLVANPENEMAFPLGVVSRGPVQSVYLGFHREHAPFLKALGPLRQRLSSLFRKARVLFNDDARSIAHYVQKNLPTGSELPLRCIPPLLVSSASASSATFARLLYCLWFGEKGALLIRRREAGSLATQLRPVELLIGDEALARRSSFHAVLDLGSLWKEMTDLPFVYALWQTRSTNLGDWKQRFMQAGEIAENRMQVDPAFYVQDVVPRDDFGKEISLGNYWKCISYQLGAEDFKGLLLFLCLARTFQVVPKIDAVAEKIIRWQQFSFAPQVHTPFP